MGMTIRGLALCAVLFVACPSVGWCDAQDARQALIELEHKRYEALIQGDLKTYDAMLGEEFFHSHVLGGVLEKEPHVKHLAAGKSKIEKAVLEDIDVRLYGDVAVVTAISHVDINRVDLADIEALTGVKHVGKEPRITRHSRHMHVWVKRDGDWKLVARQATEIPDEPQ